MDLNLLRTFLAVFEARNLTRAAQALHVTQSAVSQSLARVRREAGDELFYWTGREMHATPFALEIYPEIRGALDRIDAALASHRFDPAHSDRRFRIALSELGEMHWITGIIRRVVAAGSALGVEVIAVTPDDIPDLLARGAVDVAIHSANVPGDFPSWTLKEEFYSVVMAADNPLARAPIDIETYLSARHLVVSGESGRFTVEHAADAFGGYPVPVLSMNHFAAVPEILAATDLIATIPGSLAVRWAQDHPLALQDLPMQMDTIKVRLYARSGHQDAAALTWFRDLVIAIAREAPLLPPRPNEGA